MIIVADTSVLNYLVRMNMVEILEALYKRVIVPPAVIDEMRADLAPAEVKTWAAKYPEWLKVSQVIHLDATLPPRLGDGEREAISLAMELAANVVLMDDQAGRFAAEARGLFVSGTLAVLLQASRLDLLDFASAVAELKHLGFRVSAAVEADMFRLSKA